MRRTHAITRGVLALGFGCLLTVAVFIGSGLRAQLPVASASGAAALPAAPGDTYCVAVISSTYPGCTRVFTSVQAAVDAATGLETIKVSQGTYTALSSRPVPDGYVGLGGNITQVAFISKTVFIQGGYTTTNWITPDPVAHPTTLNAQSQGRVVLIAGNITPTITGLRLINGNATNLGGYDNSFEVDDAGGGIYIISATALLSNSWLTNNTANTDIALPLSLGGGAYLNNSPSILYGNLVATNTAQVGGGVGVSSGNNAVLIFKGLHGIQVTKWRSGNRVDQANGSATIDHNVIIANTAPAGSGGGLAILSGAALVTGNAITDNSALDVTGSGGGVYLFFTEPTFKNNLIANNQAGGLGAGVYVSSVNAAHFLHTTLVGNFGGDGTGIYIDNSGPSTVWLTNTILMSHTIGLFAEAGNTANLESTLFGGGTNTGGTGTINVSNSHAGNPGFVNPAAGNYHLTGSSAAIDQGINAGVTTDIDDNPRPLGLGFDLGADEFFNPAVNVSKSASASSALPGAVITYTIRVTNTGNVTLTTFLSDTLPLSVTFKGPVSVSPAGAGGLTGTPPGVAGGQSIGLGKSITVTFPVTLNTGAGMSVGAIIINSAAITTSPSLLTVQPLASAGVSVLNASPVAANDVYTTGGNTPISMSVRDNDTDPNGETLTVTAVGTPLNGIATIAGGVSVVYTPTTSFFGTNAFTYTVRDPGGLSSTALITVNVANIPISDLTAQNSSPTALGSATFLTATQSGGTGVSYTWNFGDGPGTSSGQHQSHVYSAVGTFTATVTATNVLNQLVATTQVVIGVPVSGLVATSNSPTFAGSSTAFTATIAAGTNVAYQWDFGDGGTGSGANTTHVYTAPGSYTAIVTATNLFGSQIATTTVTSLAQAGLSLIATDTPDPAAIGKPLVYTLVIHNSGPISADNVVVTDTLSAGVTFGTAVTTQGTCGAPTVTCNFGTLINGGIVTVTIVVTPSLSITSPAIIINSAGVGSTTADPSLADNIATITTTIYPRRLFLPLIRR